MWYRLVADTEKILNGTFYAAEWWKNIPEWYGALKRNASSSKVKSLKLFYMYRNQIHTNI